MRQAVEHDCNTQTQADEFRLIKQLEKEKGATNKEGCPVTNSSFNEIKDFKSKVKDGLVGKKPQDSSVNKDTPQGDLGVPEGPTGIQDTVSAGSMGKEESYTSTSFSFSSIVGERSFGEVFEVEGGIPWGSSVISLCSSFSRVDTA